MQTNPSRSKNSNPKDSSLQPELEGLQSLERVTVDRPPARRGRPHSFKRPSTSPDLFPDGTTDRMASNRLIWEGCNILTQGENLPWISSGEGSPYYESPVAKGKGYISFWVANDLYADHPEVLEGEVALALIEQFDIRAACMHLIYAAHATQLERPWEQSFVLSDIQLERYLGLDQNKKMNKQQKLQFMLDLAKQPCRLLVYVSYPEQGKVPMFTVSRTWLWEIAEPSLHFQECLQDENGNHVGKKQLVGFTLKIRCGHWAEYFLNKEKLQDKSGYYEYGILSKELLHDLMSTWHHHEGAARLMTWLLFKTKVNRNSPLIVETLMKVAFGEDALQAARESSKERKRIVRLWLTSLKTLLEKRWRIAPDPDTYPFQYWVEEPNSQSIAQIPDDPDEAVEFWVKDAQAEEGTRITDSRKRLRGSFEQLLNGRLWIQPPTEIADKLDAIAEHRRTAFKETVQRKLPSVEPTSQSKASHPKHSRSGISQLTQTKTKSSSVIESGEQLRQWRISQGWSQSVLADKLGRSPSWVKMVESGKRKIQPEDQSKLLEYSTETSGQLT